MKQFCFILLAAALMVGCSPKIYYRTFSDAYIERDQANNRTIIVWTWKLERGGIVSDTTVVHQALPVDSILNHAPMHPVAE